MLANKGFKIFVIVWFGQLVSLTGTAVTRFALLIWAYEQTGSATTLALLGFYSFVPYILVSPIAGVWVDRLDRRRIMMVTDLGAGLMTLAILGLYATGSLEIWHLFVAEALTGFFEAFQVPAYTAVTTLLIPKNQYARASGMNSMAHSAAQIGGPVLAGLLLGFIHIEGVMIVDIATVIVALLTLLIVRFPTIKVDEAEQAQKTNTLQEIKMGLAYIYRRRGLRNLLLIYCGINFAGTVTYFALLPTLILARTGGNELALATVQAALGIGGVLGGLVLSVWGGPKKQIHGVLAAAALSFWLGDTLFAIGRTLTLWTIGGFMAAFFIPFIVGANRAIWQSKVDPHMQGRVFSLQGMLQTSTMPLAYLVAGPLADKLFEPAMAVGGVWAGTFGGLVGTGPGAGIGLMFAITAVSGTLISLAGYLLPAVRNVEAGIPDHVVKVKIV